MITDAMLDLYCRFRGDLDGFARIATADERAVISDAEWTEIDAFLQEIHLVKAQLAAPEYAADVKERFHAAVERPKARKRLWALA